MIEQLKIAPDAPKLNLGEKYKFEHLDGTIHTALVEEVFWCDGGQHWLVKAKIDTKRGVIGAAIPAIQFEDLIHEQ